ncbi:hypothetical protein MNBD_UNCLBAC01-646 [hydrothermal vent metagenome]|uniref:phosphoglycerate mutase (2,3-diphosphoglycerate-dependent) n=1 Tax=hydrothermal vent metagenome TaxID=652676 RepID=A0A3B1CY05_9ZZZZ
MIEFILIRHGATVWSEERRYQGSSNICLSSKGKKQIQRLSKVILSYSPDVLYSSTLSRAQESAAILFKPLKKKIICDERINELNFGSWEGKTASELIQEKDVKYQKWMQGCFIKPPLGESVLSLKKRVGFFMQDCIKKHDGKTVAVMSHGGVLRCFIVEALGLSRKQLFQFHIDTATITVMTVCSGFGQLVTFNTTSPRLGKKLIGC